MTLKNLSKEEIAARRSAVEAQAGERRALAASIAQSERIARKAAALTARQAETPAPRSAAGWLRDCVYAVIEWARMNAIVRYYRAQGFPQWQADMLAEDEMQQRIRIEKFRDYASRAYIANPSLTPEQIKQAYYAWATSDTLKDAPDARQNIEVEMHAVAEITDCFVGKAKRIYERRCAAARQTNFEAARRADGRRPDYETRARRGFA